MRALSDELRGSTDTDRDGTGALVVWWSPRRGQRVKLSEHGIWSLVAWPVRGNLPPSVTRRGLYTRKITDHSVGTCVSDARDEGDGRITTRVHWDGTYEPRRFATCFLEAR